MSDLSLSARILDVDDVLVLALTEAAGYLAIPPWGKPDRAWRRQLVASDDVEGDVETQAVLSSGIYQLGFLVSGSTGAQVETRIANLLAAVEARRFHLEVTIDGVLRTWLASRADSSRSFDRSFLAARKVPVLLRVPVQPRPLEE